MGFIQKAKVWCKEKGTKAMLTVGTVGTAVCSMAVTSHAADGATGGSATSGVSDAVGVFGNIWTLISGNPVLTLFIGVSVLGAGVGLFSKIFSTVKRK